MADTELPPVVDTTATITDTVTAPAGNEKQDESPLPSATIRTFYLFLFYALY